MPRQKASCNLTYSPSAAPTGSRLIEQKHGYRSHLPGICAPACLGVKPVGSDGNSHPETVAVGLDAHDPAPALQAQRGPRGNMFQDQGEPNTLAGDKDPGSLEEHATGTDITRHRRPIRQLYGQRHPEALSPAPVLSAPCAVHMPNLGAGFVAGTIANDIFSSYRGFIYPKSHLRASPPLSKVIEKCISCSMVATAVRLYICEHAMWLSCSALAGVLQAVDHLTAAFAAEMAQFLGRGHEIKGGGALAPTASALHWRGTFTWQRPLLTIPLAAVGSQTPHHATARRPLAARVKS
jgi:hypothetical protein